VTASFEEILDLREVPLRKQDFEVLKGYYKAVKNGCSDKSKVEHSLAVNGTAGQIAPTFKVAAQIDLDKFHSGLPHISECPNRPWNLAKSERRNFHFLDWDELIEEMFPEGPDYANPLEKIEDEFAQADGRC
jgi:hypothetical protein